MRPWPNKSDSSQTASLSAKAYAFNMSRRTQAMSGMRWQTTTPALALVVSGLLRIGTSAAFFALWGQHLHMLPSPQSSVLQLFTFNTRSLRPVI